MRGLFCGRLEEEEEEEEDEEELEEENMRRMSFIFAGGRAKYPKARQGGQKNVF